MKIFWLDVETTGLEFIEHDIVQLAFIIEEYEPELQDGVVLAKENFFCSPINPNNIEGEALKVMNTSRRELLARPQPEGMFLEQLMPTLDKHIDKFDKKDKLIMAGWNTSFDRGFLRSFWKKLDNKWFGSYFEFKVMDVYALYFMLDKTLGLSYENHKLETIAKAEGVELQAHDALEDIRATRDLFYIAKNKYLKGDF